MADNNIRDNLMYLHYFNDLIERDRGRVDNFEKMIANGEVAEGRMLPVKTKIHDLKLGMLVAGYSRGDDLNVLHTEYSALIEEWRNAFAPDYYNKGLQMFSLGALFNTDKELLCSYYKMYKTSGMEDWLFEFLVSDGSQPEKIASELRFPKAYGNLKELILRGGVSCDDLETYLKGWYRNHSDCGWHNSHKSKQMIYHGYWSFEAGVVAKLHQIEDDALRGAKYYPYDLVHF